MDIAVLGAGKVGGILGKKWSHAGHNVGFGVRDPHEDKYQTLLNDCSETAKAQTVAESVASANVVVIALPWNSVNEVVSDLDLNGKLVIDCTNAIASGLKPVFPNTTSAAEQIAAWAAGAHVFKAFNTTGWENMENPDYHGTPITMFYCGDSAEHQTTVHTLIQDVGFEPWFVGELTKARFLEPLALLWISEAIAQGKGRDIAFKMMKR